MSAVGGARRQQDGIAGEPHDVGAAGVDDPAQSAALIRIEHDAGCSGDHPRLRVVKGIEQCRRFVPPQRADPLARPGSA